MIEHRRRQAAARLAQRPRQRTRRRVASQRGFAGGRDAGDDTAVAPAAGTFLLYFMLILTFESTFLTLA